MTTTEGKINEGAEVGVNDRGRSYRTECWHWWRLLGGNTATASAYMMLAIAAVGGDAAEGSYCKQNTRRSLDSSYITHYGRSTGTIHGLLCTIASIQ